MTNIYINGDNNVVNVTSGQPVYVSPAPAARRKPEISLNWDLVGVLIGLVLFFIVEIDTLPMVVLGVVCLAVGYGMEWRNKRLAAIQARRRHAAALKARADDENVAYLQGDSRGMYGDYQPEKL